MMRFGKYLDGSVRAMAGQALDLVLADAGLQTDDIQAAYVSNSFWGMFANQHSIRGQGGILAESGGTTLGGSIPVNTSGGLEWPYDHVGAVITMGYPAVQIDRPVPREFPRVLWVEQES